MSEEKMRKIKFKAFSKKANKMFENVAINSELIWDRYTKTHVQLKDYDDLIFLEFTGLLDKNGKEIYEGDVVRFQSIFGVVEYTKDCAFEVMRKLGGYGSSTTEEGEPLSSQYEIIGDIYQNPELLEDSHA